MTRKKKLEIDEHRALGETMKRTRADLMHAVLLVTKTYGLTGKLARLSERALRAVEKLRCELDEHVVQEHPGQPDVLGVYYGSRETPYAPTSVARRTTTEGRG